MKKLIVVIVFISVVANLAWAQTGKVKGNGNFQIKEIAVGSFKHLRYQSCLNLIITNQVSKIKIEADENIIPLVSVSIENEDLIIEDIDNKWFSSKEILKIYIPAQQLGSFENYGSGNISIEEEMNIPTFKFNNQGSGNITLRLKTNQLEMEDTGSGNITILGQAQNIRLSLRGSGNLNAKQLQTEVAEVALNGSGNATINCAEDLNVTISGTGNLSYIGNPKLEKQLNSTGKIFAVSK